MPNKGKQLDSPIRRTTRWHYIEHSTISLDTGEFMAYCYCGWATNWQPTFYTAVATHQYLHVDVLRTEEHSWTLLQNPNGSDEYVSTCPCGWCSVIYSSADGAMNASRAHREGE